MFSVQQKREIADAVQKILRDTNHPELPLTREIQFRLLVIGEDPLFSWAEIRNNDDVPNPDVNPYNEIMDPRNATE